MSTTSSSSATTLEVKIRRKPRRITERMNWSEEIERALVDYARDSILEGKPFEKPSAPEYYKRCIERTPQVKDLPVDKIVQHMRTLKTKYTHALEWRNRTGQGILIDDPENGAATVEAYLLKLCKYFKELDEILGDKAQFTPPFLCHAGSSEERDVDKILMNANPMDSSILEDAETTDSSPDKTFFSKSVANDADGGDKGVLRQDRKKMRKSPTKSAAAALEAAMNARVACEDKRLQWEIDESKRKFDEERVRHHDDLEIKNRELEFAREKWLHESRRQEIADERRFELEKMKLEKESELMLEKQRMQIQKELELEKFRLQFSTHQ